VSKDVIRLFHQGVRLKPAGLISDYDIADHDQIDVTLEQLGGF